MFDNDFYPTPPELAGRMIGKIVGNPMRILDPEAGKGDLIEALTDYSSRFHRCSDRVVAIEINPELRATLRGKGIKVIDSDFLDFSGPDKFDLILANPPFSEGDKHLMKMIDIMYRGQIICLLNAETLRNPCTNLRKDLARKLEELGAEIEYIQQAFVAAERKTDVEVAMVSIVIERRVEDDLFAGVDDRAAEFSEELEEDHELATRNHIANMVAEFNQVVGLCTETVVSYYRNYRKVGRYIGLNQEASRDYSSGDLTAKMQAQINAMLIVVRKDFWRRALDLREVQSRLTEAKQSEFEAALNSRCDMDFTENNVRSFVLNLINGYEKTITESVLAIFDKFTIAHSWSEDNLWEKNIHYFNGWKTNKAWKVGKRVVIPIYGSYSGPFTNWGKWKLDWKAAKTLRDIDIVMNYFDGMREFESMAQAIEKAFEGGQSSGIFSTYFKIACYQKGTIHLTFRDEGILRRFNVMAARGKSWLPPDYGVKEYGQLTCEERSVVDSFEGEKAYTENLGQPLIGSDRPLLLAA